MQLVIRPDGAPRAETTSLTEYGTYQALFRDGVEVGRAYLQWHPRGPKPGGRELITLAVPPTRPETAASSVIRAGTWQIAADTQDRGLIDVYVQRDDAIRGFRGGGRQARLTDGQYQTRDQTGRLILDDPAGQTTGVMRAGSVNAFANGALQIRVGGTYDNPALGPAPYSSLGLASQKRPMEGDKTAPAERSRTLRGVITMGAMSGSRQAVAGTSMAAPKIARDLAMKLSDGTLPRSGNGGSAGPYLKP